MKKILCCLAAAVMMMTMAGAALASAGDRMIHQAAAQTIRQEEVQTIRQGEQISLTLRNPKHSRLSLSQRHLMKAVKTQG